MLLQQLASSDAVELTHVTMSKDYARTNIPDAIGGAVPLRDRLAAPAPKEESPGSRKGSLMGSLFGSRKKSTTPATTPAPAARKASLNPRRSAISEEEAAAIDPKAVAFFKAAADGDAASVAKALSDGQKIDLRDKQGYTALNRAAENNHAAVVTQLLGRAAKSLEDGDGYTPLHNAARRGHAIVVELLTAEERRREVDARTPDQTTALMEACSNGHADVVKLLLGAGAKASTTNAALNTPMHLAAWQGHLEVVDLLLAAGGKVLPKDSWEKTALDYAKEYEDADVGKQIAEKLWAKGMAEQARARNFRRATRRNSAQFGAASL